MGRVLLDQDGRILHLTLLLWDRVFDPGCSGWNSTAASQPPKRVEDPFPHSFSLIPAATVESGRLGRRRR